ncbi:MAG: flagellar basal-body rod protein FlgF [Magnetococcales bacterium]|nr:flagellar basal-body rod protein FlgF [Magnetococcales bacterium]MBF0116157.1 flagellar basal-body rod protein FlgF [Magnetococcales bacterium]
MDSGLYAAVNGAMRASLRMDVLSNNLANSSTTGFKEDEVTFDSYMTKPGAAQFPLPGDSFMGLTGPKYIPFPFSSPASNAYSMTYPRADGTHVDVSQGSINHTGNPLDLAIEGEGYFVLNTPQGRRYTRDGSFAINAQGELVNKDGYPVLGAGGAALIVGNERVEISPDGTIANARSVVGRLMRVTLPAASLEKAGGNLFQSSAQERQMESATGGFLQGFVEQSNVNVVRGMTQMIEVNRAFEAYMQMIRALDGLDGQAAQIGRLS